MVTTQTMVVRCSYRLGARSCWPRMTLAVAAIVPMLTIAVTAGGSVSTSDVIAHGTPSSSVCLPGQEYRYDVFIDTTGLTGDDIVGVSWASQFQGAPVTITRASLPDPNNPSQNPEDLFYGVAMDPAANGVTVPVPTDAYTRNWRMTADSSTVTQNRSGLVASYWFVPNPVDPRFKGGAYSLNLNTVRGYGASGTEYAALNAVHVLDSFYIPPPEPECAMRVTGPTELENGQTYTIYVEGRTDVAVAGVQWRFRAPEYLVDWTVRKPTPQEGFFFEDESMAFETLGGPDHLSAYLIWGEVGPRDWCRLAEFTFTVDCDGAVPEPRSIFFQEGACMMLTSGAGELPIAFESLQFELVPEPPTLTVNRGSGSGDYTEGTLVQIVADAPATGYRIFDAWTGDTGYVEDVVASTTNVTMPALDVTITATYVLYELTVASGSGSGYYLDGEIIPVSADPPPAGQGFSIWAGDIAYISDIRQADTMLTMPANAVHITATYGDYYALTVTNGSGSGQYIETQIAQVSADPPDTGKLFARWIGDFTYVADRYEAATTLTMPSADISVTAIYAWAYELTVNSGTGDGLYLYGSVVDIQADQAPTGKLFDLWTGDIGPVAELDQPSTTVEMPSTDVEVTATYADVLYTLIVYSGNGGGSYLYGESVQIDADDPPFGQVFSRWIGDVAGVTDVDASITTITMPPSDVEITATYRYRGDLSGPSGVPDGFVGQADLDIILDAWGDSVPPGDPRADISGPQGVPDGFVGQADLDVVLDDWGEGTLPSEGSQTGSGESLPSLSSASALLAALGEGMGEAGATMAAGVPVEVRIEPADSIVRIGEQSSFSVYVDANGYEARGASIFMGNSGLFVGYVGLDDSTQWCQEGTFFNPGSLLSYVHSDNVIKVDLYDSASAVHAGEGRLFDVTYTALDTLGMAEILFSSLTEFVGPNPDASIANGMVVGSPGHIQIVPAGDLSKDGFVGQADLDIILDAWGDIVPPGDSRADVSGPQGVPDGFVGQADLDVVLDDWGEGTQF